MIKEIDSSTELTYEKLDGILAILITAYISILTVIFWYVVMQLGWLERFISNFENIPLAMFIFYIPVLIFELLPIFAILKCRNQTLKSVGINKEKILKQIFIGIILYLPLSLVNSTFTKGANFQSISIWNVLYMLIEIAFVEEVIFRGYVQQRLKGLIKNRYINLFVVAFLFGIIHIPLILVQSNNISFIQVFLAIIPRMIIHVYLVGVFKAGDNSILPPTIVHAIHNLIVTL